MPHVVRTRPLADVNPRGGTTSLTMVLLLASVFSAATTFADIATQYQSAKSLVGPTGFVEVHPPWG